MSERQTVIDQVRAALGRCGPLTAPPAPPELAEPLIRLVHADIGLPELFAQRARAVNIGVDSVRVEELAAKLIEFLRANNCRKLALPASPLLKKLEIERHLVEAGFNVRRWADLTLDEAYDLDCGVTDAYAAVAETGSIVVRASAEHGRGLSLVPLIHVAILEPKIFVPDLLDLLEKLSREGVGNNVTLITGPSKTSDIEMTLVVGVHGPNKVQALVLA